MKREDFLAQVIALVHGPLFPVLVLATILYGALWLRVFRRAGLPPVLGALMFVPPLTFLQPLYIAFARWPVERPVIMQNRRRVAIRTVPKGTLQERLKPRSLVVPELDSSNVSPTDEIYAGREFIPLRLRIRDRATTR